MTAGGALQWAAAALCASMLLTHGALAAGILRARRRDRRALRTARATSAAVTAPPVSVSVVVAAMNEQEALPHLLASLAAQTTTAFELVLVDDRSSDATAAIMERHRAAAPYPVRVVRNRRPPAACTGKQQALDLGVAAAGGELLLFTDADCILPATWVERLAAYFGADPGGALGVVFGQLAVRRGAAGAPRRGGFLERYQAFEQPLVHQYSTGSAGLGQPTGCFGNNLALRAPVLARLGGFRSLGYTLTEDAALIGAVSRAGWRVRPATLPATQISTAPQPSWRGFINQHVRWNGGAFFSSDRAAAWGYRYVTLFLIASVAAAPAALLAPWLAVLPCTSLLSIGTLATLEALLYHRRRGRALARVVPYTLFFMGFYAYITLLAIAGVRTDWKGSRLAATQAPVAPNADAGSG